MIFFMPAKLIDFPELEAREIPELDNADRLINIMIYSLL